MCDTLPVHIWGYCFGKGVCVDPHPVKRTAKKYKDFSQYGRYAVLWQLEIRVAAGRAT